MNIYVIIVTFNGMQWIEKSIKSFLGSSIPVKIIIIDNASTDGTLEYIKKEFLEVIVLENNKNLGFGGANNIGMRYAIKNGADYVFLSNQDVYQKPSVIEELIKVHRSNSDFGILSPIHMNGNGDKLDKNFSNYINYNGTPFLFLDALQRETKDIYEVSFVNAAAWLIPVSTLNKIGGFDPLFFHYGEDDNYCQRLKYHNLKIGVAPNSFIHHDREFEVKRVIHNLNDELKINLLKHKLKLSNINTNFKIQDTRKKIIKDIFKNLYLINFKLSIKKYMEWRALKHIKPRIIKSRKQNILLQKNYL